MLMDEPNPHKSANTGIDHPEHRPGINAAKGVEVATRFRGGDANKDTPHEAEGRGRVTHRTLARGSIARHLAHPREGPVKRAIKEPGVVLGRIQFRRPPREPFPVTSPPSSPSFVQQPAKQPHTPRPLSTKMSRAKAEMIPRPCSGPKERVRPRRCRWPRLVYS